MYCKLVKVSVDVLHEFVLLVVVSLLRGKLNCHLSSSSGVDTFEATLVQDVLTPSCADRMILLTSSSVPSFAMSNAGGREWARMDGVLHGAFHGAWQIFRFQSLSETKLIKNCSLPS